MRDEKKVFKLSHLLRGKSFVWGRWKISGNLFEIFQIWFGFYKNVFEVEDKILWEDENCENSKGKFAWNFYQKFSNSVKVENNCKNPGKKNLKSTRKRENPIIFRNKSFQSFHYFHRAMNKLYQKRTSRFDERVKLKQFTDGFEMKFKLVIIKVSLNLHSFHTLNYSLCIKQEEEGSENCSFKSNHGVFEF